MKKMSDKNKEPAKKTDNFRVSKEDRKNLKSQTNWAYLVAEERKEGKKK